MVKNSSCVWTELFYRLHLEFLACLCIVFFITSGDASADIAVCKQLGPHIIPIESKNIAIEEEHLEVTMHDRWSRIRARFIMKNNGELQDLKVGLPQVVLCGEGPDFHYSLFHPGKREGLWDISVTVDGKSMPYKISRGMRATDSNYQEKTVFRTEQGTLIEIPGELGVDQYLDEKYGTAVLNWLSWGLQFQPGQKKEISVAYSMENCTHGSIMLIYMLKTARLWQNGKIKELTIKADFGEGFGTTLLRKVKPSIAGGFLRESPLRDHLTYYCQYEVRYASPGGYRINGRNLTWSLSDFEPENLSIGADTVVPILCSSVLDNKTENGPQMATDGRLDTAWIPSRPTGESIIIPVCPRDEFFGPIDYEKRTSRSSTLKGLRIFSGCGRNSGFFAARNRPKTIEILGTTFELKDICAWQYIELPGALLDQIHADIYRWGRKMIPIKIIDVYRGSRYDATYLTEAEPVFE
jgi:hypothetical protein